MGFNTFNTIVLGITTDLTLFRIAWLGLTPLICYVLAGWALVRIRGYSWAKLPFGAKVYGSLSLALALNDFNKSQFSTVFLNGVGFFVRAGNPLYSTLSFFQANIILFSFLAILILVIILQVIVIKKNVVIRF